MTSLPNHVWTLAALMVLCSFAAAESHADTSGADALRLKALEILKQYKQPADTPSQLKHLQNLLPKPGIQQQVKGCIKDLGDKSYQVRQRAHGKLAAAGLAAREQLLLAAKEKDLEVRSHALSLLAEMESESSVSRRESLTFAALVLLRLRGVQQAAPLAWAIAEQSSAGPVYDAASETIWALILALESKQSSRVVAQEKIESDNVRVQAIAVVALELAAGADAVRTLLPFLSHENEHLRLAAARALVDRKPRIVADVLITLLQSENPAIAAPAKALLEALFQQKLTAGAGRELSQVWRDWADDNLQTAAINKLGLVRLDLSIGTDTIEETFTLTSKDATRGYRQFQYESGVATKASVRDGVLRLSGDAQETDQRLFITSGKVTGAREWPRIVEVRAKLTGEEAGSGGYHVGVSVGRLKALFHPGYSGGGFRIETTDDHEYIVNNTNLGFTPTGDKMHEIYMKVTRTATGASVNVEVTQAGAGGVKFKGAYKFTSQQLGDYNRVGLERSGRRGGDALFDSVTIRLQK